MASEETQACTALPTGENAKNTDFLSDHFTLSVHAVINPNFYLTPLCDSS